eukprot:6053002-Amphidinium_carterae.1
MFTSFHAEDFAAQTLEIVERSEQFLSQVDKKHPQKSIPISGCQAEFAYQERFQFFRLTACKSQPPEQHECVDKVAPIILAESKSLLCFVRLSGILWTIALHAHANHSMGRETASAAMSMVFS